MEPVRSSTGIPSLLAALPGEIQAVEKSLKEVQASYTSPIPENRMREMTLSVVQNTTSCVSAACGMCNNDFFRSQGISLTQITLLVLEDKDRKAGKTNFTQAMSFTLTKLLQSSVGKEALLRVLHAIGLVAINDKNKVFFPEPRPPLEEVFRSAVLFAARPLEAAITKAAPSAL